MNWTTDKPTEAGWTSTKPTEAGWYWYKVQDEDGEALEIVQAHISEVDGNRYFYFTFDEAVYEEKDMDGEWLGPISPTDRQQGRVAAFKEASRKLDNLRDRYLTSNETDLHDFERWLAQAAQQGRKST